MTSEAGRERERYVLLTSACDRPDMSHQPDTYKQPYIAPAGSTAPANKGYLNTEILACSARFHLVAAQPVSVPDIA
eukprot:2913776-Rhodomonas_salina.3